MISFRFDDNAVEHFTVTKAELEERGFRGTFGVNAGAWGNGVTGLSAAQALTLLADGHDLASHDYLHTNWTTDDVSGNEPVEDIVGRVWDEIAWVQANTELERFRHFFVPFSDWASWDASQCDEMRESEQHDDPCRQPIAAMFYDYAHTGSGSSARFIDDRANPYDLRSFFVPNNSAHIINLLDRVMNSAGPGGEWIVLAWHDICASGCNRDLAVFEAVLDYIKLRVDDNLVRVVSLDEGANVLFQGRQTNNFRNPNFGLENESGGSPTRIDFWGDTSGDCVTAPFLCLEDDPDIPLRQQLHGTGAALGGTLFGMKVGYTYVAGTLFKITSDMTSGSGMRYEVRNASGYSGPSNTANNWVSQQVRPGNGTNTARDIGSWADGEWGVMWTKFKALSPTAVINMSISMTTCASGQCEWIAKYPFAFQIGHDAQLDSTVEEPVPYIPNFIRQDTGFVASGSATTMHPVTMVLKTTRKLNQFPIEALITKVGLTVTAGVINYTAWLDSYSTCNGDKWYPINADTAGVEQAITTSPWVERQATYYKQRENKNITLVDLPPDDETMSNTVYVCIANADAGDTTFTIDMEGVILG
jgi:hypothetical protein